MVFLHGFPEFWYAWKDQLDEFGRDHLAVAPDMRGYNLSSKPVAVDQYRMPLLIEDVRALAAHLRFGANRKFILVGHDWGGVVAWSYAAAHPDTIEKHYGDAAGLVGVFIHALGMPLVRYLDRAFMNESMLMPSAASDTPTGAFGGTMLETAIRRIRCAMLPSRRYRCARCVDRRLSAKAPTIRKP
jgi:pimeloyl-ACP methyl ester carboxylesterase